MKATLFFILGIASAVLSGALLYSGCVMETAAPADPSFQLPAGMNGIANLQAMHVQSLTIEAGLAAAIATAVLWAASAIIDTLERPAAGK